MTTYRLSGSVIDDEGTRTEVNTFTCSAQRNDSTIEFYVSNGFKGSLLQVRTELNGIKTQETIRLESCDLTQNAVNVQ